MSGLADDPLVRAVLRQRAEEAKIALSSVEEVLVEVPEFVRDEGGGPGGGARLSRTELEHLTRHLTERSLEHCDAALVNAGLVADDIQQVLLVGGQTRMPAVRDALSSRYGWNVNTTVNPAEAVALGAAVLAARLCDHLVERVKLWDVIPLSLGVELADGRMERIIEANTNIPVSIWRKGPRAFTTQHDGQERILLNVYQGERSLAADNHLIGKLEIDITTSRPAGEPHIECQFTVDPDGILHVQAVDAASEGSPVEVTFDHLYSLSAEEVEQRLRDAEGIERRTSWRSACSNCLDRSRKPVYGRAASKRQRSPRSPRRSNGATLSGPKRC